MKKSFQILGIITLLVGSFIYNEKVGVVSKLNDDLLTEIKDKQKDYKQNPIEATIIQDTIIPGRNGKKVDVKKTYTKMKQIGYFNDKLITYKPLKVKNELKDNKDKYIISANKDKKSLSLIFKVNNKSNINKIISILDNTNTKATFFIDSKFLENNQDLVMMLINKKHIIGNLSNKENYNHSDFVWMKTIITKTGNQKNNYCYTPTKNKQILKNCSIHNSYTIIPTKIINERPFITIKNNINKGSLIMLNTSKELENELENIINYIISKGYQIQNLEKVLKE
ncbi:MAG: polysaccharide deacetylase family protein [Bacilli bacterium]|nr:polysaccharide deacetylase family protein [Bacilli bacterium]